MSSNPMKSIEYIDEFAQEEDGAISIMNLFFVVVMAIFAGVAIDMSNLIQARTQLQVAADTAAHAALYTRDSSSSTVAKAKATEIAREIMPTGRFGNVLREENIHFGTWDRANQTFTVSSSSREAVYVETDRLSENANPVTSFLMQFVGYDDWDIVTPAVFETYRPTCLREGFVAQGIVDIQSGNDFSNGFCIHSNTHVSANQNNTFEAGTIVSMPNLALLDIPSSGFTRNDGLESALRKGRMRLRILTRMTDIMNGMTDSTSRYYRSDFITNPLPISITKTGSGNGRDLAMADMTPGRVHNITCTNSNGELRMAAETWSDIVIITNCEFSMLNGAAFENATLITTANSTDTVKTTSGFRLGVDDSCAGTGGAQLLTFGDIRGASGLELYGSQIMAAGDVEFTAQNEGIEGASIIAGGEISITSGSQMGFCGTGMETTFQAEYFRMAG